MTCPSHRGLGLLAVSLALAACVAEPNEAQQRAQRLALIRNPSSDPYSLVQRPSSNSQVNVAAGRSFQGPVTTAPAATKSATSPATQPTESLASTGTDSQQAASKPPSQPGTKPTGSGSGAGVAISESPGAVPVVAPGSVSSVAPDAPGAPLDAGPRANEVPAPLSPDVLPNAQSRLGPQVILRTDGRITKFFPVRADRGKFLQDLAVRFVGISASQIEVVPGADTQETRVNPYQQPAPPAKVPISDWLAVTGTVEEIERVDRFLNLYFSSVPQIEIEARIAEVTTSDLLDIGVRPTNPQVPMFDVTGNHFVQGLNSNFPNGSSSIEGLLSLQAVQSPIQFQATLEFLATKRNIDIISTPRIAVRNGGRAEIVNGNDIPYAEITTIVGGVPSSTIRYKQTGVKLFVTPYLAGTDTVLLSLEMELSIPTSVTETTFVTQSPIIATRSAKTDVNLRDGNTFVVGGLISTNNLEQVNKIPILGDIPIIGLLFRSTQTQKQYTEVLFFITPRVIRDPGAAGVVVPNPG